MNFKLTGRLVKKAKTVDETKMINCKLQFRVIKNGDKHPALCIMYDKSHKVSIAEIITKIREYSDIYFKGDTND